MGNTNFLVDRSQNDLPDKAKSLHRHGCPLRHHDDVSKGWKAPYTLCLAGGLPFRKQSATGSNGTKRKVRGLL